jgi:hypothetical protein
MSHKPLSTLSVMVSITTAVLLFADTFRFRTGLPRARKIDVPKNLSLPHLEHTTDICI